MGGGYGKNIDDTVAVHLQTITIAARHARSWEANKNKVAADGDRRDMS